MPRKHDSFTYKSRPTFIVPLALALLLTFGIGPNFLLLLIACGVLVIGVYLLWRPGEPLILLFIFTIQWLQVASTLALANIRGVPVSELHFGLPAMDRASFLVILALFFVAVGMRLGAGAQRQFHLKRAQAAITTIPPARWLRLHIVMWGVSTASLVLASWIPGLSQGFLALAGYKWVTFFILTIVTFSRRDASRAAWFLVFMVEFFSAIGGYFATFKLVFMYTLVAISAVGLRLTMGRVAGGAVTALAMLTVGLFWTAVKPDYRAFVSRGETAQVVLVGQLDAITKVIDLTSNISLDQLSVAGEQLANRFAEMDQFSAVLTRVPASLPHEGGALWWDSITRPMMPRIIFPNKAIIDESEITRRYTGVDVAGFERGTQVSMGYIAESYIDFSEFGMWGVLLIFGAFIGRIYRWCVEHPNGHGIFGFGIASLILMQVGSIGFSSAKLVGGILVSVLVAAIVLRAMVPITLNWLRS